MVDDFELRKYAIEKALDAGENDGDLMDLTAKIYTFLKEAVPSKAAAEVGAWLEPSDTPAPASPFLRSHKMRALTSTEKAVLKIATDLFRESGRVTGTDIGRAAKFQTPTMANTYVKRLTREGYMRRDGWFVTPVLDVLGQPLPVVIQKLPDGVAKGYSPMRATIGEVGRVVT